MRYDQLFRAHIAIRRCTPLLAAWIAIVFLILPTSAFAVGEGAPAPAGQLLKVVILSRHGVRSPTQSASELASWTVRKRPWPVFQCGEDGQTTCAPGQLTTRGAVLSQQMGTYYRNTYSALVGGSCPDPNDVFFWANANDSSLRTKETAQAILQGFFPQCNDPSPALHEAAPGADTVFNPVNGTSCQLSLQTAQQAIQDRFGDLNQYVTSSLGAERTIVQGSLRCCQSILCSSVPSSEGPAGNPCKLAELPTYLNPSASPPLAGGLYVAGTFSEILLFEYASGFAPRDVGWGIDRPHMVQQFRLNTGLLDLMRARYLAQVLGSRLLNKITLALQGDDDGQPGTAPANAKFVAYVGHDTNIANVARLLRLDWQQTESGYQENQSPPAGALIFELRKTGAGEKRVYVYYTAQTLDQLRYDGGENPTRTFVPVPRCGGDGSCSLDEFTSAVELVRIANASCWN